MILDQWARDYHISAEAMTALFKMLQIEIGDDTEGKVQREGSESKVSNDIRLEASRVGARLWRNNVGACQDKTGRMIRYGLANDSKKMNDRIKSADLIGIKPVLITADMVGCTIGQYLSREAKEEAWQWGDHPDREIPQLRWALLILMLGGDACFANRTGTL